MIICKFYYQNFNTYIYDLNYCFNDYLYVYVDTAVGSVTGEVINMSGENDEDVGLPTPAVSPALERRSVHNA